MSALTISVRRKPKSLSALEAENFIAMAPAAVAKVREPGFERRQPEADLQQQRQQEGQGADADAEDEAADDAGEEGRDLEQP